MSPSSTARAWNGPRTRSEMLNVSFGFLRLTGLNSIILQVVEFSCLGDWVVGKNQYFAVANTKESRIDEKFRCFMKNRDDDYFLGQSNTPECNHIKTVEQVRFGYFMLLLDLKTYTT